MADASKSSEQDSERVESGHTIRHGEINFDGSSISIYSRDAEAGDIFAEYYFVLSYPAQIDVLLHGKTVFRPVITITGMEGALNEQLTAGKDEEEKRSLVLGPGGYSVRIAAADTREMGGIGCDVSFSKKDLEFNGIYGTNTRDSAMQLMADVPVNDYFFCSLSQDEMAKFYTFDMSYNGNISFFFQKSTDICNLNCSLLNESGGLVDSWDEYCTGQNVKSVYIPAGKYYLKVQQGNSEGGAYSLNIR